MADPTEDIDTTDAHLKSLRTEALAAIKHRSNLFRAREENSVERAFLGDFGPPAHVLKTLIAHLPNHEAQKIVEAIMDSIHVLPANELITNEHIIVSDKMHAAYGLKLVRGQSSMTDLHEYKEIVRHAMRNIEDGHLIHTAYAEREIHTLQGIIDLVPVLKTSGHPSLTEGVL